MALYSHARLKLFLYLVWNKLFIPSSYNHLNTLRDSRPSGGKSHPPTCLQRRRSSGCFQFSMYVHFSKQIHLYFNQSCYTRIRACILVWPKVYTYIDSSHFANKHSCILSPPPPPCYHGRSSNNHKCTLKKWGAYWKSKNARKTWCILLFLSLLLWEAKVIESNTSKGNKKMCLA